MPAHSCVIAHIMEVVGCDGGDEGTSCEFEARALPLSCRSLSQVWLQSDVP